MPSEWVKQWGYELDREPVRPGIYRLKDGGYLLRAKLTERRTGKEHQKMKVLRDATLPVAEKARAAWLVEAREAIETPKLVMPRFDAFAASLFEKKVQTEKIRSAAGRRKWEEILRLHLFPAFGSLLVDDVTHDDVERWLLGYAADIKADELSPRTANTRLGILKVIFGAASAKFGFKDPTAGIEAYDTTLHPTYTPEEPNSLTVDELPRFLHAMMRLAPQHYALTLLGFVTGLRPSTLFPLLIADDVLWEKREVWIRRSHTYGQEVMQTTKTGHGYPIGLPEEVMRCLRWHIDTHIGEGRANKSGLVFPSDLGTIRLVESLAKPFVKAAAAAGIKKSITPRAMRRTFQDVTRAANVESVVKRSISGHATEEMEGWYSTVAPDEQRVGLAKVIDLMDRRAQVANLPSPLLLTGR